MIIIDDENIAQVCYTFNSGHINNMKTLIACGSYVRTNQNDNILLLSAINSGELEKVKFIIEMNINVDYSFIIKNATMMICSQILNYLLENVLDPNIFHGYLLNRAIQMDNIESIKILFNHGADAKLIDLTKSQVISTSIDTIKLLASYGVDFSLLNDDSNIDSNEKDKVDLLITFGVNPIILAKLFAVAAFL